MASYESWIGDGPERQILFLMGLFDRPAEREALAALRAEPPIPGLTDKLYHYRDTKRLFGLLRRREPRRCGRPRQPSEDHRRP